VAANALGQIRSEAAVAPLMALLSDQDPEVRSTALSAASSRLDPADRRLLTCDLDGALPFLDPQEPIRDEAVRRAASRLDLTSEEVRRRYDALAEQFQLNLEWRRIDP